MENPQDSNAQNKQTNGEDGKTSVRARLENPASDRCIVDLNGDKGLYGETLRPSEREDSYEVTVESVTTTVSESRRTPLSPSPSQSSKATHSK